MTNKFYVVSGVIKKGQEVPKGGFDLERLLKWYLNKLNVPFFDECCPDGNNSVPVRDNDGTLESLNEETGLWEPTS